jgi:hypothetical protein
VQLGPSSLSVDMKLRDGASVGATQPRPVHSLDFSKGGAPQYLWIPRVQEDGYKGPPPRTARMEDSGGEDGATMGVGDPVQSAGPSKIKGGEQEYVHKGAPPEIEFQVRSFILLQHLVCHFLVHVCVYKRTHRECNKIHEHQKEKIDFLKLTKKKVNCCVDRDVCFTACSTSDCALEGRRYVGSFIH